MPSNAFVLLNDTNIFASSFGLLQSMIPRYLERAIPYLKTTDNLIL